MKLIHEYNDDGTVDNGWWEFDGSYCYNRYGGRHPYAPGLHDEIVESSWEEVLRDDFLKHKDEFITGWLAPNGDFFGCAPEDHWDMAKYVFGKTERELEDSGYLKIYEVPFRLRALLNNKTAYGYFGRPTEAQMITLENLGIERK